MKTPTDEQRQKTPNSEGKKRSLANLKPFPKGVSGNPAGRPRRMTLSEALKAELAAVAEGTEDRTIAQDVARKLCQEALAGNVAAIREVFDRTEGRAPQALEVNMQVTDWRAVARQHGLSLDDVKREAQLLLSESPDGSSDA